MNTIIVDVSPWGVPEHPEYSHESISQREIRRLRREGDMETGLKDEKVSWIGEDLK